MRYHPDRNASHKNEISMEKRILGCTEYALTCVGLGEMPLSLSTRPDRAQAIRVIHAALDAGMNWIDTADVYCSDHNDIGHGEVLVAEALGAWTGDKSSILVTTKGGLERPDGAWTVNAHPDHLTKACEASLRNLGTDSIGLYQLHAPDPDVPIEDSIGALLTLQAAGKIQNIGVSNFSVPQIEKARAFADIVSVQNRCNPFDRGSIDTGVVDYCTRHAITFIAHSPVGGHQGRNRTPDDPTLCAVAARHNASPFEICIAWLLYLSEVVVTIPGATRVESAQSSVRAEAIQLTQQDLTDLHAAFPA